MFAIVLLIPIVFFVSFAVLSGIAMIVKIWNPDHAAKMHYNQLKNIVKLANKGDLDAIRTCEGDSYNIKSSWWKNNRFSVRRKVLYECFPL